MSFKKYAISFNEYRTHEQVTQKQNKKRDMKHNKLDKQTIWIVCLSIGLLIFAGIQYAQDYFANKCSDQYIEKIVDKRSASVTSEQIETLINIHSDVADFQHSEESLMRYSRIFIEHNIRSRYNCTIPEELNDKMEQFFLPLSTSQQMCPADRFLKQAQYSLKSLDHDKRKALEKEIASVFQDLINKGLKEKVMTREDALKLSKQWENKEFRENILMVTLQEGFRKKYNCTDKDSTLKSIIYKLLK